MKKYFLIPQPPITEKLNFLVDDINEEKTMAFTTDFDKIEYNLNLMGKDFREDVEIGMNLVNSGVIEIIDLGRYLSIVSLSKTKKEGSIYFFDVTTKMSRVEHFENVKKYFSENIAKKFIVDYDIMVSESSPSIDNVELIIPDDL